MGDKHSFGKFCLGMFFLFLIFFLAVPNFVYAAIGCRCAVKIDDYITKKTECQIDTVKQMELDMTFTVKELLDSLKLDSSCDSAGHITNNKGLLAEVLNKGSDDCEYKSAASTEYSQYDISCHSVSMYGKEDYARPPLTGVAGPKKEEIEASVKSGFNLIGTLTVPKLAGRIIKAIMGVMGSVALAMFVYAGVLWMTASGNAEQEGKSMKILVWSSLGVIVIFASYALLDFVFEIVK